jgi:hypothetical protein
MGGQVLMHGAMKDCGDWVSKVWDFVDQNRQVKLDFSAIPKILPTWWKRYSLTGVSKANWGYKWGCEINFKNTKPSIHGSFKASFNRRQPTRCNDKGR